MKRCPKCTAELALEAFGTRKMGDKVVPQSWCRACRTTKKSPSPAPAAPPAVPKPVPARPPKRKPVSVRAEVSVADVMYFAAVCYRRSINARDWALTPPRQG